MFKLLTQKRYMKRTVFLPAVAVFGLTLGMADFDLARAALTPDLQTQVDQILAAGGPDLIANLAALAETNLDAAADILEAGCAGGADCSSLATAISAFTDDATDAILVAIAGTYAGNGNGNGNGNGSGTSENPNQSSGSETGG